MGYTKRTRRLAAWAAAGLCAVGATGAPAQDMRPAERDAAEQRRIQLRNAAQHQRIVPPVNAPAEPRATPADTPLPAAESPCFTLNRIAWQLDKKNISTFFPPSWSQARIEYEITEAFKQGMPGTSFIKTSPSGMRIQFHWDAKNKRTTFHPLGDQ